MVVATVFETFRGKSTCAACLRFLVFDFAMMGWQKLNETESRG
jgi:hypothetical protein